MSLLRRIPRSAPFSFRSNSQPYLADNAQAAPRAKIRLQTLLEYHSSKTPIVALTAHDYTSGYAADMGGVDIVLVGDSLAMVALGMDSTTELTLNDMIHHAKAVSRAVKSAFLVGDLPFGTYENTPTQALHSAIRMIREGRVEAVKIEGGSEMAPAVQKITSVGIPVLGHIGMMPQRQTSMGGFRAESILVNAKSLQEAGCFGIVLEAIPGNIAKLVTDALVIPTIGIGAGVGCSGQILVQLDMLGSYHKLAPKFVKQWGQVGEISKNCISSYCQEVRKRVFPGPEHTYSIKPEELDLFKNKLVNQ
ncbi:3-methyl-2-oxobutanoate hydroxymethyltransferase [Neolecta irregularis DAH-3]|uniref:3-methyl-2-oxobutanoate hydroxymethyltransferase n=1 Tax=Neolecta irregularis (strain DAH-3) TaxID=1198029 RepID=A0A1U7LVQ3_NEOID|nr:3-methyl-2-oxobutanoate hydroxymethyltransferase [Neolecta irregularis DAH-3]|eukprot:OLL26755.1 3-methyl-2-oxobutanoate hydroxymethyltransferase [Neolecta irregularis DAH-3]